MKIKKAIIACAGFGTRFLPITKTIQKEMLPILERPLIDYLVEDCIKAGIEEIIFVISEHNYQVLHFYRENQRLHEYLGKTQKLALYEQISKLHSKATFHFVKQKDSDPYGTAEPVILAKDYVKDEEAFLVLMGDDFIYQSSQNSEVATMINSFEKSGAKGLITCVEKETESLSKYGVVKIKTEGDFQFMEGIIEKPELGTAPSNLVNISKYILGQEIWPILEQQKIDPKSGELYITDTIQALAKTEKVLVHKPQGKYLDGGYPLGWLIANLVVAKDRPEIWAEIKNFID
jgi:UTP--glucose-1-phosphate uridylyltransferase